MSITIPDGVECIEWNTFSECYGLESITLPKGITSIGDEAFFDCTNLSSVYYNGTKEQWSDISIGSYNSALTNAEIVFLGNEGPEIPDIIPGDLNADGIVNAKDSNLLKRVIAGSVSINAGSPEFLAIDLNSDGELNAKDSNILKRFIAGSVEL